MANAIILGLLEMVAIGSCGYGIFVSCTGSPSYMGMIGNGLWFILGLVSNVCGIVALVYLHHGEEDEIQQKSQYYVQYHYLFAWATIVVGYPSLVTQTWMTYYATHFALLHILLSVISLVAWIQRKTTVIVLTTQIATIMALISHAYISYCASNVWSLIGSGCMIINVVALSMPTRYNLLGFSSRELYVCGLAVTSYIFCLAFGEAAKNPKEVKLIGPFH